MNGLPPPYKQILELIEGLEDDFIMFYEKGNKAAGTRIRKGMQELNTLAHKVRVDVQNTKYMM
jgi:hypothetical protein